VPTVVRLVRKSATMATLSMVTDALAIVKSKLDMHARSEARLASKHSTPPLQKQQQRNRRQQLRNQRQ
jgi:hypothetical protein